MKKFITPPIYLLTILSFVFFGCEKMSSSSQSVNASNVSSITANQLAHDSVFINLYLKAKRVMSNANLNAHLTELSDDTLTYAECKTLYPKLGFPDSASLVVCIKAISRYAIALSNKHYNLTNNLVNEAIANLSAPPAGGGGSSNPCQDAVIGTFIVNVAQCGALGLIPVIGEVLAGTCMVGALITYNAGMQQCV